jgi:hypothetical protein
VDTTALLDDLAEWEMVAQQQDDELRSAKRQAESGQAAAAGGGAGAPAIRRGAMVRPAKPEHKPIPKVDLGPAKKKQQQQQQGSGSSSARHTYDHYQDKWDKWDNANFIEEVLEEEEEQERQEEQERKQSKGPAKPQVSEEVRRAPVKQPMSGVERRIMCDHPAPRRLWRR